MTIDPLFRSVCDDVETITGIKTVLFNAERHVVHAQEGSMCAFCAKIRETPALREMCTACDSMGIASCTGNDIHIYRCHMGLVEAVAPIEEDGLPIAFLMFGQILPEHGREEVLQKIRALPSGTDRETLTAYLSEMSETSEAHIRAAARILAMCASYVRLKAMIPPPHEDPAHRIAAYVTAHLSEKNLSVSRICTAVGISRTSMYLTAKEAFGLGVSDFIRKKRVEEAVRLLRSTSLTLDRIAEQVGFSSGDYLSKRVRSETGMTPRQIRKRDRPSQKT